MRCFGQIVVVMNEDVLDHAVGSDLGPAPGYPKTALYKMVILAMGPLFARGAYRCYLGLRHDFKAEGLGTWGDFSELL